MDANKEKALTYFTKGYKLAKEKHYLYLIKISYLFMYKARKHLFKKNMITLRKLNKTQKKLLKIYEAAEENYLSAIELYNYYRLYKFGVIGNSREKVLRLLKSGKNKKIIHQFSEFVYKEKCKRILECENSVAFLNQNNMFLKSELLDNNNDIYLKFKTTEGKDYQNGARYITKQRRIKL